MKMLENIGKACCVFCLSTPVIGVLIYVIFDFPDTDEFWSKYLAVVMGLFCFFGLMIIVIAAVPESVLKKMKKNDKSDVPFKADVFYTDFNELRLKIVTDLKENEYKLYETESEYRKDKISIYYKHHGLSTSYYVIMYADNEDVNIILNETSEIFEQCVKEIGKRRSFTVFVSSMLCVNRVSSAFYKHLNDTSVKSIYEFELRSGYSFGGKTLYIGISPLKDAGIAQTKKMRKQLLNMFEITKKDLRK